MASESPKKDTSSQTEETTLTKMGIECKYQMEARIVCHPKHNQGRKPDGCAGVDVLKFVTEETKDKRVLVVCDRPGVDANEKELREYAELMSKIEASGLRVDHTLQALPADPDFKVPFGFLSFCVYNSAAASVVPQGPVFIGRGGGFIFTYDESGKPVVIACLSQVGRDRFWGDLGGAVEAGCNHLSQAIQEIKEETLCDKVFDFIDGVSTISTTSIAKARGDVGDCHMIFGFFTRENVYVERSRGCLVLVDKKTQVKAILSPQESEIIDLRFFTRECLEKEDPETEKMRAFTGVMDWVNQKITPEHDLKSLLSNKKQKITHGKKTV